MSADFSCFGGNTIKAPHVDPLAAEGRRFTRAFVTAPICSISRSALITGRYQLHHWNQCFGADYKSALRYGRKLLSHLFTNEVTDSPGQITLQFHVAVPFLSK